LAEIASQSGTEGGVSDSQRKWSEFLLEQIMRYDPLGTEDRSMFRNNFWEWSEKYSGYIFGPSLIIVALLISRFVRQYYSTHFLDDLIVALIIAGVLAMTVDPFVKRRVHREAGPIKFKYVRLSPHDSHAPVFEPRDKGRSLYHLIGILDGESAVNFVPSSDVF
jgi:hypothetical protein